MRFLLVLCLSLLHCAPSPTSLTAGPEDPTADDGSALAVTIEPPSALDAAPPILRVRVTAPTGELPPDPERLALAFGSVGSSQLGQLARDDVSMALAERLLDGLTWRHDDEVWLAPFEPLVAGELYSVASGMPKQATELTVAVDDPLPRFALVWPPQGRGAGSWPARWCAPYPLGLPAIDVPLAPDRGAATLAIGATQTGLVPRCIHLRDPSEAPPDQPRLVPPALPGPDGAPLARVDPQPLTADGMAASVTPRPCDEPDLVPFGPGCLRVWDDRALLLPPEDGALLWVIPALDRVIPNAGASMLLDGLPPNSSLALDLVTVDAAGVEVSGGTTVTTLPAMPHVVIHEVLANPVGEEPQQEWVELYNDGLEPASLGGYQLEDVGGVAVLPAATLPPGGFALVVNESFDEQSEWDPMPPPETLVLRVEQLAKNGLANGGEPIRLRDAQGAIVSRFPAAPKPKAGLSVARRHPRALDDDPEAFLRTEPTPNAPNVFDED